MATIYAPQYRDPNAEFKRMMMQMAMMVGGNRKEAKLSEQRQGDIRDLSQYGKNIGEFEDYQADTQRDMANILSTRPGGTPPGLAEIMQGEIMGPEQMLTGAPRRPEFPNLKSPLMQKMASSLMLDRALPQPMTSYQKAMLKRGPQRTLVSEKLAIIDSQIASGKIISGSKEHLAALNSGASSMDTPEERLSYWQTAYNKTLDDFSMVLEGQEETAKLAVRKIKEARSEFELPKQTTKTGRNLSRDINRATKFPDTTIKSWGKKVKAKGGTDADIAKLLQIFQSGDKENIKEALRRINGNIR